MGAVVWRAGGVSEDEEGSDIVKYDGGSGREEGKRDRGPQRFMKEETDSRGSTESTLNSDALALRLYTAVAQL